MGLLQEKLAKHDLPQQIRAKGVYPYPRCIKSEQNTEVVMSGRRVLMFGLSSYLGLTNHPKVIEVAVEATREYGTGCAGLRFLNGTLDLHLQLEKELTEFVGREDAIIYSTGFQVSLDVVPYVTGCEDYVICDELDRASIIGRRRLSSSTILEFKYNNMKSLKKELRECRPDTVKLIVVDGIFSMEGDIVNLSEIVRLSEKYDVNIMVDEAHDSGVLGNNGRGTCNRSGLTKEVDLIMGTFNKSLAAIGGFIAANESIVSYLHHNSRSYIFGVSNMPAVTAAAHAAPQIMKNEPERIEHLWDIANYSSEYFREFGFEIGHTPTLTIPLYVRGMKRTFMVIKMLFDEGVFVNPVVPPTCSPGDTLIRFSLMATHSKEQVDFVIGKLVRCLKILDLS